MTSSETTAEAVRAAAADIRRLDPGTLADLRRMREGRIAPAFWRQASKHPGTIGHSKLEQTWMAILRILAILTPTGNPDERPSLHDHSRRLGRVLCDGGDPGWTGPIPALSESRLSQLLSARGNQRAVLLTRAARAIARSRVPGSGVNVVDIAVALLWPDDSANRIAKPYYDRLDAATRTEPTGEEA